MTAFEQLVIIGVGLWRVVSILANEDGPFNLFESIRRVVWQVDNGVRVFHSFGLYKGYTCEWCLGMYLSCICVVLWVYFGEQFTYIMLIPALSTVVIVFKYIVQTLQEIQKYVVHLNNE